MYILESGIKHILYRGLITDILDSEIKYINILYSGINSFQIPSNGIKCIKIFVNVVLMSGIFPSFKKFKFHVIFEHPGVELAGWGG